MSKKKVTNVVMSIDVLKRESDLASIRYLKAVQTVTSFKKALIEAEKTAHMFQVLFGEARINYLMAKHNIKDMKELALKIEVQPKQVWEYVK